MHVVIIGNGISGITCARWVRKLSNDHKITVISKETDFFYSRTALMYIYMGHMRFEDTKPYEDWFWGKNRIDLIKDEVRSIDHKNEQLKLKNNSAISYDKLVIAVGSKPNKFGWPGQDLKGVSGLYHFQDLETMEAYSKNLERAVIVGGGLIGIEMAEMFHSRHIPVSMIVRESSYWNNILPPEESEMINKHILEHGIDLKLGVNLDKITGDENGIASGIVVKETGEKIDCGYVGLTAGVSPNVSFLKDSEIDIGRGIKVNEFLETNLPNVYAIGDCAEQQDPVDGRRAIEAVWYTGRMMGETAAYNICGIAKSYDPGIWFNSAKFLDIEYQVYGNVQNQVAEDQSYIYWESEDHKKSIRILYKTDSKAIDGFNLMGIRYRHEVCEKWLKNKTHIEEVLQNLSLANFDPEFYKSYEQKVIDFYNQQSGSSLKLKKKRKLDQVLSFLSSKSK